MFCDICKKNEATVHLTKIINGVKQELNICEKCAKEAEGIDGQISFGTPFSFQNLLSGIMDYMSYPTGVTKATEVICKNCGTSYSDFKKTGLLGCSECYRTFESTLEPVIKRVQGHVEHTGKLPKKMGKDIIERKKLLKLKEDLQKAIAAEEYERAAQIRDTIKSLQSGE